MQSSGRSVSDDSWLAEALGPHRGVQLHAESSRRFCAVCLVSYPCLEAHLRIASAMEVCKDASDVATLRRRITEQEG
jgi:hypothetical protein